MSASRTSSSWRDQVGRRALLDGALVSLTVFAILTACLQFFYRTACQNQIESVRTELVELARIGASQVDAQLVRRIQGPEQAGSPEHLAMLAPLVKFHKASRDLMYVFVARLEGARVRMDEWHGLPLSRPGRRPAAGPGLLAREFPGR